MPELASSSDLWEVFRVRAEPFGHRAAVHAPQGKLSFGEVFTAADRVAAALARSGLPEGCFVAYAAPNSAGFIPGLLGLWRLSVTVGLVSPQYGAAELVSIDQGVRPFAFLVPISLAAVWSHALGRYSVPLDIDLPGEPLVTLLSDPPAPVGGRPGTALVKFTSGSTGEPKGVALSPENVLAEARAVAETLALTPEDGIHAPIPLCHSYGFDLGVLATLYAGASLVLPEAFVARRSLAELSEGRCSVFLGVPSMFRALADTPRSRAPDLSGARYLLSCTAPLSPELIAKFHQRFRAPICQHYGSSEAGAVTTHDPSAVLELPDSVGRPMRGVSLAIEDDQGRAVPVGTEGDVVVRSPAVAQEYIMGAEDPLALRSGTCRMGDLGVLDGQGFLYLRGRRDQLINVGGLKVSPVEVARVLERHPKVREAAVTGVTDNLGEEVVYAVVALRQPGTEAEILSFCRGQLAEYKVPRRIDIRDDLPRGPTGKIKLQAEDLRL